MQDSSDTMLSTPRVLILAGLGALAWLGLIVVTIAATKP